MGIATSVALPIVRISANGAAWSIILFAAQSIWASLPLQSNKQTGVEPLLCCSKSFRCHATAIEQQSCSNHEKNQRRNIGDDDAPNQVVVTAAGQGDCDERDNADAADSDGSWLKPDIVDRVQGFVLAPNAGSA